MAEESKSPETISVAMTGAGGAGVVTASQILLDGAGKAGWYGLMTRSSGPQIRGGESAAFVRLSLRPVAAPGDTFDIMLAFDWMNIERFAAELPLNESSLLLFDPAAGEVPEILGKTGARCVGVPLKEMAKKIPGGRPNMIGLGIVAALIGLPAKIPKEILEKALLRKGEDAVKSSAAGVDAGFDAAKDLTTEFRMGIFDSPRGNRWNIKGNAAIGLGALRGGVRFVAAYPITPATEVLEWLAPNLEKVGGHLVQAEDELASISMVIGSSFGGVPSLTATSGPGLSLMMECLGLATAAEIPIVVVDVMRGGPSTGIPTKSEQSDLNIALYGMHGDAPHIVTAPNSVGDCLFTSQWTVHLAEALQAPAILLSDQLMGQANAIIERPDDVTFDAKRATAPAGMDNYRRYAITPSGVSPMAIPGTPGGEYVADGLEHDTSGTPSSQAEDHAEQLDKRQRKIDSHDYGGHWADVEGSGDIAVVTWGSSTGPGREAVTRAVADGVEVRLISIRLMMPAQSEKFRQAMEGVKRVLVVEQSHSQQFFHYLRAYYELPEDVKVFSQPGPLPIRPGQIHDLLVNWS